MARTVVFVRLFWARDDVDAGNVLALGELDQRIHAVGSERPLEQAKRLVRRLELRCRSYHDTKQVTWDALRVRLGHEPHDAECIGIPSRGVVGKRQLASYGGVLRELGRELLERGGPLRRRRAQLFR